MENNTMKLELANAIADSLWMRGLISKEELLKIKERNAETLTLKKV